MGENTRVLSVDRIENGLQVDGSAVSYYNAVRRSLEDQSVTFEPGSRTVWAFHGADEHAIQSIISNPMAGVQPLVAGSRAANVWGSGTYLARDAKYVAHGGFCGQPDPNGTLRMLMCLTTTGIPCQGDPAHKGLCPTVRSPTATTPLSTPSPPQRSSSYSTPVRCCLHTWSLLPFRSSSELVIDPF